MKYNEIEKRLMDEFAKLEVIDCHEHLGPERHRTGIEVDVFTFFQHYTRLDLFNAGMKEQEYQQGLLNREIPLETRWKKFAPYRDIIKHTSYYRAILISIEKLYGISDLNENTYQEITKKIKETNKPGLYENVLKKTCNIKTSLTQCGITATESELLTPLMPIMFDLSNWQSISHPTFGKDAVIRTLDDFLDAVTRYVVKAKSEGAVGLKMVVRPNRQPDRAGALSVFEDIKSGKPAPAVDAWPNFADSNPLYDYVNDWTFKVAKENEMTVAVHTGYWGDFRQLDPLHIIPILQRHPDVRFDIYHLGYPWLREAIMLGKGFPNVWLNLCWTHIISQRFAMDGIDELLDTVPVNKVLGFGGDYGIPVEKVCGHLYMANEDMARVFAKRIAEGRMTEDDAIGIAKKWLYENPKELYRLKV